MLLLLVIRLKYIKIVENFVNYLNNVVESNIKNHLIQKTII